MTDAKAPAAGRLVGRIQASSENAVPNASEPDVGTFTYWLVPLNRMDPAGSDETRLAWPINGLFHKAPPLVPAESCAIVPSISSSRHQLVGASAVTALRQAVGGGVGVGAGVAVGGGVGAGPLPDPAVQCAAI